MDTTTAWWKTRVLTALNCYNFTLVHRQDSSMLDQWNRMLMWFVAKNRRCIYIVKAQNIVQCIVVSFCIRTEEFYELRCPGNVATCDSGPEGRNCRDFAEPHDLNREEVDETWLGVLLIKTVSLLDRTKGSSRFIRFMVAKLRSINIIKARYH